MKKILLLILLLKLPLLSQTINNPLKIPPIKTGTTFNLNIHTGITQFTAGKNTNTMGYDTMNYLGPTLEFQKGDNVSINITNSLKDTTTVHWHGLHIPPKWDGGPMNMIMPGDSWHPQFLIMNNASTYWYHSHLHEQTANQVTKGLAGLIIIHDSIEQALNIPKSYGVDDFPLIMQDKEFDNNNQIQAKPLGSTMMVNGTLTPYLVLPKQVIRLRLLNASIERSFNFGFSDNRNFYQIGTDGGLLETSLPMKRLRISPGERAEVLIDLSKDSVASVLYIMSYSTELGAGVSGAFHKGPGGGTGPLDSVDFKFMKILVNYQTSAPILTIPEFLTKINFINPLLSSQVRTKHLLAPKNPGDPFTIDGKSYDMKIINDTIKLGSTETWIIINDSPLTHPIHIHDIQFNILSRNAILAKGNERSWKDIAFVYPKETLRVVAKFDDFADPDYAYMYHCHILAHEDDGMMHQFIVVDTVKTEIVENNENTNNFIYPNPATNILNFSKNINGKYIKIYSLFGEPVLSSEFVNQIDIGGLNAGIYFVNVGHRTFKIVKTGE